MKISIYVPARINSTRLPRKNLLPFHGTPLVGVVPSTLRKYRSSSKHAISYCVNTSSMEIAEACSAMYIPTYLRPDHLSQDDTTTEEILADYIMSSSEVARSDIVAIINPTSPCLTMETISPSREYLAAAMLPIFALPWALYKPL